MEDFEEYRIWKISIPFHNIPCWRDYSLLLLLLFFASLCALSDKKKINKTNKKYSATVGNEPKHVIFKTSTVRFDSTYTNE